MSVVNESEKKIHTLSQRLTEQGMPPAPLIVPPHHIPIRHYHQCRGTSLRDKDLGRDGQKPSGHMRRNRAVIAKAMALYTLLEA